MKKIPFEDLPSTKTPIDSGNMNLLQNNVEEAINEKTITFDNAMSSTSTNGVQNRIIKEYVDTTFVKVKEIPDEEIQNYL